MAVRVRCDRCNSIARIESSQEISATYKKLYCSCRNPHCGHTWVMDLSFSHTLSPSAMDLPPKVREQVQSAGCRQEQLELFGALGN